MARPRREVIRAAVAQNRAVRQPRMGVSQNQAVGHGSQDAAPPPGPAPLPWDGVATAQSALAQRNYGNEAAGVGANEDFTRRNIGLGEGYENNPYSQASLLQRQRDIATRGTLNTAGNQLYAGSTVNRLGGVERSYEQGRYGLEQQLAADEAKWGQERQRAQTRQEEAELGAQEGAIERAAKEVPEPAPLNEGANQQRNRGRRRGRRGR